MDMPSQFNRLTRANQMNRLTRVSAALRYWLGCAVVAALALSGSGTVWAGAESEVQIEGLSATLLLPTVPGKSAAILISGSGPTDRDGNNPYGLRTDAYKLIAQALDAAGVVTVRYDKRGIARSAAVVKGEEGLSVEQFADDVVSVATWLRETHKFSDVYLIGHSEGGLLALLAAERVKPKGIVLLTTPGRPMAELLREQFSAPVVPEAFKTQALTIIAALEKGESISDVSPELQGVFRPSVQGFLRTLMKPDPAQVLAKLTLPVLIVGGSKDAQVVRADFDALVAARGKPANSVTGNSSTASTAIAITATANAAIANKSSTSSQWLEGMTHALKTLPAGALQQRTYTDPNLALAAALMPAITEFLTKTSESPQPAR